jgi:hypothetical protein
MASFAPIRGSRSQIIATPTIDGQILFETDQGSDGKIYIDVGTGSGGSRIPIGGGSSALSSLGDVLLDNPTDKQLLQYNSTDDKWENTFPLDDWLRNGQGQIIKKILTAGMGQGGATEYVTFTANELANVITNNWSVTPYVTCATGVEPPNLIKTIEQSDGSLDIYFTQVTSQQTGTGSDCNIILRILK